MKKVRIVIEAEAEVDMEWYAAHLAKPMNEAKDRVWHDLAYPLGSSAVRVELRVEEFVAPAFEED